ncbi:hypothetical protein ACFXG4_27260 [Nocardia sp. NPDC059246]|uniref:hypothetical protein n=1 Tax=unclassified Nocardia TaxID=2637762 RepID=UPI0036BBCCB2
MGLFHIHRWTSWERIEIRVVASLDGHIAEGKRAKQERHCSTCGRIQRADIS